MVPDGLQVDIVAALYVSTYHDGRCCVAIQAAIFTARLFAGRACAR